MVELRLLGGLDLRGPDAQPCASVLAQPKRVALLAYLALAPDQTLRRRDSIGALLWPDQDQEHVRSSLRQAIRFLRRELGDDVIQNRGEEEVGLNHARVWCDVVALERAAQAGELEEVARLYRGGLLIGFFIPDAAPEFEEWLDGERQRVRALASNAMWALAQQRRHSGDLTDAIAAARRALSLTPDDEPGMRRLLELLDAGGDRAGAMAAYEAFAERIAGEYQAQPSAETQRLVATIRSRSEPHAEARAPEPAGVAAPRDQTARPASTTHGIRRFSWVAALAAVFFLGSYFAVAAFREARRGSRTLTVAVLPVRDLDHDSAAAMLPEALTDELITDLAQISALRVINRGTMMRFANSIVPPESVLKRLGADAVITCTLQRSGDSVRLTAQLVMAGDTRIAWARSYSGKTGRAFGWQKDVALAVAEWASVKLQPLERAGLSARRELDPEAFEMYSRGRWWWNKRGRQGLLKADTFFHAAIEVEPTYARAWSGLADTYAQIAYGGFLPPEEAFAKAKAMARRALELDSTLAEPHAALGYSAMYFDWDWRTAEREFALAVARQPSYATAHEWYGLFLAAMGRFSEAEREGQRAQELDPLSASVAGTHGWILHYAGKNDAALNVLRTAERTDAKNNVVQLYLGRVLQSMGQFDSAARHYAADSRRTWVPSLAGNGALAGMMGHGTAARQTITKLDSMSRTGEYVTPYAIALIYTALGNKDSAFARLEDGLKGRTHWMVWLNRDTRWRPLRGDPRFASLTSRIGLPR